MLLGESIAEHEAPEGKLGSANINAMSADGLKFSLILRMHLLDLSMIEAAGKIKESKMGE